MTVGNSGTTPPREQAAAAVRGLRVTFRRKGHDIHAVRGIDLEIARGEIVGLVGESGSGKSVLGLSLLGLLAGDPAAPGPATEGTALVAGTDMLTADPAARRAVRRTHLGAVFQDPMTSLNPTMTVGRQVAEAAGSGAEAVRLLTAVGIPDAARRASAYPHELSGGLRQRVMIAMAVAGRPSLVIADEPTTALDVTVQAQVLRLIRTLRDELGCAFLLITHDLGVAAQVADRVAVMYAGRLAELGPTRVVLERAAHPYSLALMRSRLSLDTDRTRELATLGGRVPNPAEPLPGCAFAPRCGLAHDACLVTPPPARSVSSPGALPHLSACVLEPDDVRARWDDAAAQESSSREMTSPDGAAPAERVVRPADLTTAAHDPQPRAAVEVTRLTKTFMVRQGWGRRRLQALRGVTLDVRPGEAVAVVGESGSGKSTLLRSIAGLDRRNRGRDEGEVAPIDAQLVFQDAGASLTPWLTVGQLIAERLRGRGQSTRQKDERVAEVLRQVGLPVEVAGAKARQLSGGQRQRVGIARAVVVPPDVLLCDEPTSALDVSLAASVINLLGRLRTELGMAVVFVTHDLAVARIVADRIAVMYLGRIVELGAAEEVTATPRHPYTQALVAAVPGFGAEAPPPKGEPASPLDPPPGCAYHPRCGFAVDSCADPTLDPRLERVAGEGARLVACIRSAVTGIGSNSTGSNSTGSNSTVPEGSRA